MIEYIEKTFDTYMEAYIALGGVLMGITWFIGTIVYTCIHWKDKDLESIDIFLSLTGGTIAAALLGPIALIFAVVVGLPVWALTKIRGD